MLSRAFGFGRRPFDTLSEQEMLALAISSEEDDGRIYRAYADGLREQFPQSAKVFDEMAEEEDGHRARLIERHRARFGERIPLIRRYDVRGFASRRPLWLVRPLGLEKVRGFAAAMEAETRQFYERAARRSTDASVRQLLGDLANEERAHAATAERLEEQLTPDVRREEADAARRLFVLQVIQPGQAEPPGPNGSAR